MFTNQNTTVFKKERLKWFFFFGGIGNGILFVCMRAKVCVCLNVREFLYVLSLAHTYIRISMYIMVYIFTYIHIFPLSFGVWFGLVLFFFVAYQPL